MNYIIILNEMDFVIRDRQMFIFYYCYYYYVIYIWNLFNKWFKINNFEMMTKYYIFVAINRIDCVNNSVIFFLLKQVSK
jgi:hypothetical protein